MNNNPNFHLEKRIGLLIITIFIIGFGLWALFAPLESASIAKGTVTVAGKSKTIQHLEGGIVEKIFIQDGDGVIPHQPLIELEDTQAKANVQIIKNKLYETIASEARIQAELDNQQTIAYPEELTRHPSNRIVQKSIQLQNRLFESDQRKLQGSVAIYQQQIEQLKQQIAGTNAQLKANNIQLSLIQKELKEVVILEQKRLVKQSRLLALQREEAALHGKCGENVATLSQLKQKIGEVQLQMNAITNEHHQKLLTEMEDTHEKIADLVEQLVAQKDILKRRMIKSPIAGKVTNLAIHTIGGVIKPGEMIMNIVPEDDELVIEAKINPLDIDIVHPGLAAKVTLTAFKTRTTPMLLGTVKTVSADALKDERTGASYYLAEIQINPHELKKLQGQTLYPGMPADVMIITDRRTAWEYFIDPIKRSFSHAFREE